MIVIKPEDNIITASEASSRSAQGTDDSLVREHFRECMKRIRYCSGYGNNAVHMGDKIMSEAL